MNAIASIQSRGKSVPLPTIEILTYSPAVLDQVYDLFTNVRENLIAQGRGEFLLYKDKAHFEGLLKHEGDFVVGAMSDGALTGFCAVRPHSTVQSAFAARHLTLQDTFHNIQSLCGEGPVAVVQSLCVSPDSNGKKIARALLGKVDELLPTSRKLAQASLKNICGWKTFLLSNYVVVNAGSEMVGDVSTQKVTLCSVSADERKKLLLQAQSEITQHHDTDITTQMYHHAAGAGSLLVLAPDVSKLTLGVVPKPRWTRAGLHA